LLTGFFAMGLSPYLQGIRSRIGHDFLLLPGVSAMVFNDKDQLLLGRRSDNGRWSIIGGIVDPDEEPADAVVREVLEETGVTVKVDRVSGVYTSRRLTYPNGDLAQYVTIAFRCSVVSGSPCVNDDESLEVAYFSVNNLPADIHPDYVQRIHDALPRGVRPAVFNEASA
jgi:8-oxo-dGTP diphosphatase